MSGTTLITGADGYVGRMIAARLLAGSDDHLALTVRAGDPAELDAKRAALGAFLGPAATERVTVTAVDLRDPGGLAAVCPRGVTAIVHSAAVTRFGVDRDTATAVNIDGTAKICAFARRCDDLGRLLLISTVYSAGRQTGRVAETAHSGEAGFVNHYEWSKWSAEQLALGQDGLPLSILRLPTVISDDETGAVTQFNAFHHTLKLFFYGLMSIVPGDEKTPVHVTSGEYAAAAVGRLLDPEVPPGIYHACLGEPPTFGDVIERAFAAFESDRGFHRRNLPRPLFCDIDSFWDLVHVARSTRSGTVLSALESFVPFVDQLYLPKAVDSERLHSVWSGHPVPDQPTLVTRVSGNLVTTRWGRRKDQ